MYHLSINDFFPELFVLQKFEEVETERVLEELDVSRFRPVAVQVLEVVDEAAILEVASLRQEVQVVRIGQALNELELDLKPEPLFLFEVTVHGPSWGLLLQLRVMLLLRSHHLLLLLKRVLNHACR